MSNFIFFIAGIVFITFIIPVLDQLLALALSILEWIKSFFSIKITQANLKIKKLTEESEEEPEEKKYYIGFSVPDDCEDDTDVQV